jgi:hypothetical protein
MIDADAGLHVERGVEVGIDGVIGGDGRCHGGGAVKGLAEALGNWYAGKTALGLVTV